jgi:hypothetical protein
LSIGLLGALLPVACRFRGEDRGAVLIESDNNTAVPAAVPAFIPAAPKKRGWLPLLTVLFLISYGLMTMLIVEQGATIESQRALIRELFRDSTELSATKMKAQQDRMRAGAARGLTTQAAPQGQSQKPSVPSIEAQQRPQSPQAAPKHQRSQSEHEKQQFLTPPKPATDQAQDARSLITI